MFRRFSANFALFSIAMDAALVALALLLSTLLRPVLSALPFVEPISGPISIPSELYLVFPIVWVAVLLLFSVYDGRRNLRVVNEFGSLTLGSMLAAVAGAGVLYFTYRDISRFLFVFFALLAYLLMLIWRVVVRLAFRWNILRAAQERRVLILGAGTVGRRLQAQINQRMFGLKLVGFLDDDPHKQQGHADVLGPLDKARTVITTEHIEDVVVALPASAHARLTQTVSDLHDQPVRVWVIPDYFSLTLHRASVEEFAGIPMLDLRAPALSEYQRMVKRAFDLTLCLLSFPFLVPLMALLSLAIWLDDRGPVFFRQERVGENGRIFRVFKFRTMVVNAEALRKVVEQVDGQGNLIHKVRGDPRVTRVGRFMRRWSLDEWPQVINIIKGEMSWVGPRPEMPYLVEKYQPWQRKRFAVPQGLTGWWQVNGRSDKPMHLHTEDDLYYVQHYSIWLDLQILVKTVGVVLRGHGAF